jgi:hypothetical protein
METSVFFRVLHSVSDIDNLRSDDKSWQFWFWEFSVFFKSVFHSAMSVDVSSVCSFNKGTCDVSGLWSEPPRLNLEETAISSTCVRKGCLAPTFVRAKQMKYVAIRTHKCPEIKA